MPNMTFAMDVSVNNGGRPTLFIETLAETICAWVAETSMGLRKICRELGLCYSTVSKWTLPGSATYDPDFRQQFLAMKEQQAEVLAEEILEIADDMEADMIVQPDGRKTGNAVHLARCRLRISVRQWLMGRLAPKRWGVPMKAEKEELPQAKQYWLINGHELDLDDDTLEGPKFGRWLQMAMAAPGPYKKEFPNNGAVEAVRDFEAARQAEEERQAWEGDGREM